jgi:hypothetical protein
MLDDRLKQSLAETHKALLQQRALLSPERLAECLSLFRARFGPSMLKKIEGEELLKLMHARPSKDSLVYWLEFKNDDEFPAKFGSIAGGSALKFGIYWRKETGAWMTGSSSKQTELSPANAIALATKQRDQLLAAADLLEKFPENGPDADYLELQKQMDRLASEVSPYSWGHKYLSLLYPTKLDDYHNPDYQRFHLIKLLQKPPRQQGLYVAAGRFVQIAAELGMPINHLTTILNRRNSKPHAYWRIGTSLRERDSIWELMKTGNFVAIGWAELGNLAEVGRGQGQDLRDTIRQRLEKEFETVPNVASRKAGEIRNFFEGISDGDLVLAADGGRILGIGRITGAYRFDPAGQEDAPHRRPVGWVSLETWDLPETEGLRTTVVELSEVQNLLETERRLLAPVRPAASGSPAKETTATQGADAIPLPLNTILYGPPGTGKTYRLRNHYMEMFTDRQTPPTAEERASALVKDLPWWEAIALALLDTKDNKSSVAQILEHPLVLARLQLSANKNPRAMIWASLQSHTKKDCPNVNYTTRIDPLIFSKDATSLWSVDPQLLAVEVPHLKKTLLDFHNPPEQVPVVCRYKFTTFHQSLSYEDFIEGIKPQTEEAQGRDDGQISYEVTLGIFREICREAQANPTKNYALFIDEINRGNVASIFGELITLIEEDKRLGKENELKTILPYSRDEFGVPRNLYIIGTMNTADRSVEALDTALRRRFTFEEMRPDASKIKQPEGLDVDLRKLFETINARIEQLLDHDHCMGHYYFMGISDIADLKSRFANRIIPLLREYFYGNPAKIGMVLGETFITPKTANTSFAPGPWGADELDEKEVFTFADVAGLTEEDFQAVYAENRPGI